MTVLNSIVGMPQGVLGEPHGERRPVSARSLITTGFLPLICREATEKLAGQKDPHHVGSKLPDLKDGKGNAKFVYHPPRPSVRLEEALKSGESFWRGCDPNQRQ
jgi:hypothetical protein